jgi:hypothetical protein
MKTYKSFIALVIVSLLISAAVGMPTRVLAADNCPNGNGGDNTLTCTQADSNGIDGKGGNDNITVAAPNGSTTNVNGGSGNDTITNNNSVTGNIDGGSGNDQITNNGSVTGNISGGSASIIPPEAGGNDQITNTGTVGGSIDGGTGNDTISNSGTVNGNVAGGMGDDSITNSGTAKKDINGDIGNDTISNSGTVNGTVDGGIGDDTITNSGTAKKDVSGGDGVDSITNNAAGTVTGNIDGGFGGDTILNNGTVTGSISGGSPVCLLIVCASDGDDNITNNKTVSGDIKGGFGNDTINNAGSVTGNIYGDANIWQDALYLGNDVIGNSGNVTGSIYGGYGNDLVTLVGTPDSLQIGGTIDGGEDLNGEDIDTLDLTGLSTDDYTTYSSALAVLSNPLSQSAGSFSWGATGLISWLNFEVLQWTGFSFTGTCATGQHFDGNACVDDEPIGCPEGQHAEGNACVDDEPLSCPEGKHAEGNACANDPLTCPTGQHVEGSACVNNSSTDPGTGTGMGGDTDGQSRKTQQQIIPVTGGAGVVDLSCVSPFITTLVSPLGTHLTFTQLCGNSAMVEDVPETLLPGALPAGMNYVTSVAASILKDGSLVETLPDGGSIKVEFNLPAGGNQQFAILFWDGSKWVELPITVVGNHAEVTAFQSGQFILVTK